MAKNNKADKKVEQLHPEPQGGYTIRDLLRINNLLTMALAQIKDRPHHWATYILGKLQSEIKPYRKTLEKHEQHGDYEKAQKKVELGELKPAELEEQFADYLAYVERQKDGSSDLKLRKFKGAWCLEFNQCSAALSAALYEFDLIDDPEALMDALCAEDAKE